jgi:hypothetical protein
MPLVSPFVWLPQGYSDTAADEIKAATDKVTEVASNYQRDAVEEKAMTIPTIDYSENPFMEDLLCHMMMCIEDTTTEYAEEQLPIAAVRKYSDDTGYSFGTKYSWDETQESRHGSLQQSLHVQA